MPGYNLVSLGAQQKIYGVTVLVDGPVEIPPFTFEPDVGLVHLPALAHRPLVAAKRLSNSGTTLITQRCTVE
jgi:hypothetical protein